MALAFRKFSNVDDMALFLKGHLLGGVQVANALFLHGKTLIFNTPSATVTFAASPAAAQVPLTLQQVKTQIEAQATGVTARFNKGRLELYATTPGSIVLDQAGTATAQLGFDAAVDQSAAPYNVPGGAAPALVQVVPDMASNSYLVVTNDA